LVYLTQTTLTLAQATVYRARFGRRVT